MTHPYLAEFLKVVLFHLLAVVSPGPDFAIVLRQSLAFGRRPAIWTSIGVGCGISWHIGYSLLGVGLLLAGSPVAFNVLKVASAVYLTWVGVQGLRSRSRSAQPPDGSLAAPEPGGGGPVLATDSLTDRRAWTLGLLTNALNPKATLFFIALFTVVISPATPRVIRAGYGLYMIVGTMAWFCLVSVLFTQPRIRDPFLRQGHWIDRALGIVFLAFAASLLFSKISR